MIVLVVEVDKVSYLVPFGQMRLKLFHGYYIVLGIVQYKVANLKQKLTMRAQSITGNKYLECNISLIE